MQQTRNCNRNPSDQIDDTLKTFDRSTCLDVYQTFAKEVFYDEHGHYVSWTRVITDIIPVKTKENLFMRRCNIVKRLQKILSQAVTQHFHCRMWGEGDRSPIKLYFIQTSSSLEGSVAALFGLVSEGGLWLWLAVGEDARLRWWASILGWHRGDKFKIIMSLVRQHWVHSESQI